MASKRRDWLGEKTGIHPPSRETHTHRTTYNAPYDNDNADVSFNHSPFSLSHDAFQMSWNLLERFLNSDHFNQDPSLTIQYLL